MATWQKSEKEQQVSLDSYLDDPEKASGDKLCRGRGTVGWQSGITAQYVRWDNGIQSYVGGNVLIFLKTFLMKYLGVNATVGFPLKYVSKI